MRTIKGVILVHETAWRACGTPLTGLMDAIKDEAIQLRAEVNEKYGSSSIKSVHAHYDISDPEIVAMHVRYNLLEL